MKITFEIPDSLLGTTPDSPYLERAEALDWLLESYVQILHDEIVGVHMKCLDYLSGEFPEGHEADYLDTYLRKAQQRSLVMTPMIIAVRDAIHAELSAYPEYGKGYGMSENPFADLLADVEESVRKTKLHPPGKKP